MTFQVLVNLVPIIVVALIVSGAIRRQLARLSPPPLPVQQAQPPAQRRRLAPPPAVRLVAAPSAAALSGGAANRVGIVPSMAETLPAEAAAAFPGLDLTLGDTPGVATARGARRLIRTRGGGPAIGSPGWGLNAVVAMEILGPPVSLRSGATVGAPHVL